MIQAKLFVEILEMSDFPDVQLMEPLRNPHLLKILYGLLMILPQNSTFEILRRRLEKGTMMNFLSHTDYNCGIPLFKAIPESSHQPVDVAELVDIFVAVQKRYKLARLRVLRNASLIPFKKKPVDH